MIAIDTLDAQDRPQFRTSDVTLPCGVIGYVGAPMVLRGRYHPDQSWLPFMQGTVLAKPPQDFYDEDSPRSRFKTAGVIQRILGEPPRMPHGCEKMYVYEEDQHVLPFDEYKHLEDEHRARFALMLWDQKGPPIVHARRIGRDPNPPAPNLHSYYVRSHLSRADIIEWARANLRGRFIYSGTHMQFQYASDAVFAKLTFEPEKPGRET